MNERAERPVLVTGGAGFLGAHLVAELARRGEAVVATSRDGQGVPARERVRAVALELDDGGAAGAALVEEVRPRWVLHLAAMSRVEDCARDPEGAERVNAVATATLARTAAEVGARFVYASTDLVFDGEHAPYAEDAPPAPLGPYMASKASGEREALAASPEFLVARLALIYGRHLGRGRSFTDALIERLRDGEPVDLFEDQHRTPVHVEDAAAILCDLAAGDAAGVVHVAGPERASRLEHGLALARALGAPAALCRPTRVADAPGLAPRPRDVSLGIERLVGLLGRRPLSIEEGCRRIAAQTEDA